MEKSFSSPAGAPTIRQGRLLVPMRGVFEAIGAYVSFDPDKEMISAKKNNEVVELTLGEKTAYRNGVEIKLDVVPQVVGGATYVPLRFLAESMGAKVVYDKANAEVRISTIA